MNYIKVIGVFLLVSLISTCNNKEKTVVNSKGAEKIELNNEVTSPAIEAFINKMISEEHFKGVVLAAVNDEVIHAKGYGMANDTAKNNINTNLHQKFSGSINSGIF